MDMRPASFDQRFASPREIAPDFGALVALLGASQAASPTARLATLLDSGLREGSDRVAALIGLFAPRRAEPGLAGALACRFNPAVPFSHSAATGRQPW